MTNPKISIIIGVLNMREHFEKSLQSVIKQNYDNLELIIMDGGSTDGTVDVIKKYEKYIAFWKSGKDGGHAAACNEAIDIATGKFIGFLNADDIFGDGLLDNIAQIYHKNQNAEMITCGVQIVEESLNHDYQILQEIAVAEKLELTLHNLLFGLPIINARFFNKDIFSRFGKFYAHNPDGSYNLSNDRDYLIGLALKGVKSEVIPEPLYIYLSHSNSDTFSQKFREKIYNEHIALAKKLLNDPTINNNQKDLIHKWLVKELVYQFFNYVICHDFKKSLVAVKSNLFQYHYIWIRQLVISSLGMVVKKMKNIFFPQRKKRLSISG